jgi:hypothetical protein
MNPNTSKFFHIKALILGSVYEIVGITAGASAEKESSSASSEDGDGGARRHAQRFLKHAEKDGGSKEKRRVWKLRCRLNKRWNQICFHV